MRAICLYCFLFTFEASLAIMLYWCDNVISYEVKPQKCDAGVLFAGVCLQCRPVYRPQLHPLCYMWWRTEAQKVCWAVAFILAVKPSEVVKATKRSREVYMKNAGVMVPGQSP